MAVKLVRAGPHIPPPPIMADSSQPPSPPEGSPVHPCDCSHSPSRPATGHFPPSIRHVGASAFCRLTCARPVSSFRSLEWALAPSPDFTERPASYQGWSKTAPTRPRASALGGDAEPAVGIRPSAAAGAARNSDAAFERLSGGSRARKKEYQTNPCQSHTLHARRDEIAVCRGMAAVSGRRRGRRGGSG